MNTHNNRISLFALVLVVFARVAMAAQSEGDDALGFVYLSQYSAMVRYLVLIVGVEDDHDKGRIAIRDFEAIYAFAKIDGEHSQRFETSGRWINSKDSFLDVQGRLLKESKHEWIERGGEIFDAAN
jgi:hypothetical protein